MNADVEELLREGIDRLAAGAHASPGLADRARRRNRRRRLAIWAAVGWGTALVAAAAIALATAGIAGHEPTVSRGAPRMHTVGYMIRQARRALADTTAASLIENVRASGEFSSLGGSAVVDAWARGNRSRTEVFSTEGQLVSASSSDFIPATSATAVVSVDYETATWVSHTVSGRPDAVQCYRLFPALPSGRFVVDWPAQIRGSLSCGSYAISGHRRVDGVEAIAISLLHAAALGWHETLWLNPSTYLPVRITWSNAGGQSWQADYRWLAPTPANLAKLSLTVPAGFHHLQLPSARLVG
jgi:hypothetical protein